MDFFKKKNNQDFLSKFSSQNANQNEYKFGLNDEAFGKHCEWFYKLSNFFHSYYKEYRFLK